MGLMAVAVNGDTYSRDIHKVSSHFHCFKLYFISMTPET